MAKILFIAEEPALQQALGGFLSSRGYAVTSALDGEAGLALARAGRPDLILLDLVLPKRHGLEVLAELRADPALRAVPVIVLTNVELKETVEEASRLGAKAYLVKTNYTLEEVLAKVQAVLGAPA